MLHLTFLDQVLDGSGHIFDRHIGVNAMLIEEIDDIDPEPLQRALDGLLDVLGLTIQACRSRPCIAATQIEPKLRNRIRIRGREANPAPRAAFQLRKDLRGPMRGLWKSGKNSGQPKDVPRPSCHHWVGNRILASRYHSSACTRSALRECVPWRLE